MGHKAGARRRPPSVPASGRRPARCHSAWRLEAAVAGIIGSLKRRCWRRLRGGIEHHSPRPGGQPDAGQDQGRADGVIGLWRLAQQQPGAEGGEHRPPMAMKVPSPLAGSPTAPAAGRPAPERRVCNAGDAAEPVLVIAPDLQRERSFEIAVAMTLRSGHTAVAALATGPDVSCITIRQIGNTSGEPHDDDADQQRPGHHPQAHTR